MALKIRGISTTEKQIAIFEIFDNDTVQIYAEDKYEIISYNTFQDIRSKPLTSKYLLLKKKPKQTAEEQYDNFIIRANEIKKITKGKINLFKTVTNAKTALHLFNSYKPPETEKISEDETDIFEKTKNGGMRYSETYEGVAYKADICSQYPSILRSEHMQFPIKEGELKMLTKEGMSKMKYFSYGIYHIKVVDPDKRLFVLNPKNWYSHIDLNRAIELKYELILIEDDEYNWLSYEGCLMNASKIFRKYIDYLFAYKSVDFAWAKDFINVLWGALCQKNLLYVKTVYENDNIVSITPSSNDTGNLTYEIVKSNEEYYETNWARIKPFLVAKGRYMISKIIEQNKENLVYTHTDGIITKEPLKGVTFGQNIGDLKYEGKCENVIVINGNKCKGDFIL